MATLLKCRKNSTHNFFFLDPTSVDPAMEHDTNYTEPKQLAHFICIKSNHVVNDKEKKMSTMWACTTQSLLGRFNRSHGILGIVQVSHQDMRVVPYEVSR
jgi:hypothetical protein